MRGDDRVESAHTSLFGIPVVELEGDMILRGHCIVGDYTHIGQRDHSTEISWRFESLIVPVRDIVSLQRCVPVYAHGSSRPISYQWLDSNLLEVYVVMTAEQYATVSHRRMDGWLSSQLACDDNAALDVQLLSIELLSPTGEVLLRLRWLPEGSPDGASHDAGESLEAFASRVDALLDEMSRGRDA
jgi:hypothetical protein